MENVVQVISTVGFPIACCLGLAYFVFRVYNDFSKKCEDREDKLYSIINECQKQIADAIETNSKFLTQLEYMNRAVETISKDVDDIKDVLDIHNRKEYAK